MKPFFKDDFEPIEKKEYVPYSEAYGNHGRMWRRTFFPIENSDLVVCATFLVDSGCPNPIR